MSAALRSPHRAFLRGTHGLADERIFAVGKVEKLGVGPENGDVVFAFVNLALDNDVLTPPTAGFDVNVTVDRRNMFGIRPDHTYNVRNIAAYGGSDPHRRDRCLWGQSRTGADLLDHGIPLAMNRVPVDETGWNTAPYEAQYLQLIDVTTSNRCQQ
jgi:hypothetical protein